MKGYYIHYNARDIIGVSKKIDMQLKEFSKHCDIEEVDIRLFSKSFFRNALGVLPYFSLCWNYDTAYRMIDKPDFLYIRSGSNDYLQYKFLRYIKENWSKCKIIVEIPTYPYWKESLRDISGILLIKDFYNSYRFARKKLIDRIITYSDDDMINGISTIKTMNGINVDAVDIGRYCDDDGSENKDVIHFLSVANIQKHHGYERVIKGLYNYYKSGGEREIIFDIVGDGTEKEHYKRLVEKYDLENIVVFYGKLVGKELENVYRRADIGFGTFAFYKTGINRSSVLKIREYLAYGLPVVSGCREDFIKDGEKCEFYLGFPNDQSSVDINSIISFYDNLISVYSKSELRKIIHEFAKERVDLSVTMKPIIEYIWS